MLCMIIVWIILKCREIYSICQVKNSFISSFIGICESRFTMEAPRENSLRKLIPQISALRNSTPKWDEEGVEKKRCKYERDDGSRREMSKKRSSSQPTTKLKKT
ncbi:Hypothetical predicted protein [Octopus vulgaris]|uniref:Uncharacterized protein n=1 Tax=Octopus vulgaris TaxID=6645 RepID=A0AA36FMA8_OCTVU|nr:Hypothetical predicted protein [Octopus vulgaris]